MRRFLLAIDVTDLIVVTGLALVGAGLALWYAPAALVIPGCYLVAIGTLSILRRGGT